MDTYKRSANARLWTPKKSRLIYTALSTTFVRQQLEYLVRSLSSSLVRSCLREAHAPQRFRVQTLPLRPSSTRSALWYLLLHGR